MELNKTCFRFLTWLFHISLLWVLILVRFVNLWSFIVFVFAWKQNLPESFYTYLYLTLIFITLVFYNFPITNRLKAIIQMSKFANVKSLPDFIGMECILSISLCSAQFYYLCVFFVWKRIDLIYARLFSENCLLHECKRVKAVHTGLCN